MCSSAARSDPIGLDLNDRTGARSGYTRRGEFRMRDMPRFNSDRARTLERAASLMTYFDHEVLQKGEVVCRSLEECRHSATHDPANRQRPDVSFAGGQLPHVGAHYDLSEAGAAIRILIVAMETGRPDVGVSMARRRLQLSASSDLPMTRRNPHMQGVTNALRLLVGRSPGTDRLGEFIDVRGENESVHLFDAYAMTNLRLCSAFKTSTTDSRGTPVMSRNCLRHLGETVRILQPNICIAQGVEVGRALLSVSTDQTGIAPQLVSVRISGVPTILATFTHPTARADQRWGGLTNVPYLTDTVTPALLTARGVLLNESNSPARPAAKSSDVGPPLPVAPSSSTSKRIHSAAGRPHAPRRLDRSVRDVAAGMTTAELATFARLLAISEISRRGGTACEAVVGRRTELRGEGPNGQSCSIRVVSRRAGDFQVSLPGDDTDGSPDRFWIFVDLLGNDTKFAVVSEEWMIQDIRREHAAYLARHGGRRAVTPGSVHHRVQTARLGPWQERWELLGLALQL